MTVEIKFTEVKLPEQYWYFVVPQKELKNKTCSLCKDLLEPQQVVYCCEICKELHHKSCVMKDFSFIDTCWHYSKPEYNMFCGKVMEG